MFNHKITPKNQVLKLCLCLLGVQVAPCHPKSDIINDDNTHNTVNIYNSTCFCLWGSISYNQAPTHCIGKTKVKVKHPLFDFGQHGYLLRARSCAGVVLACLIYFYRADLSFLFRCTGIFIY